MIIPFIICVICCAVGLGVFVGCSIMSYKMWTERDCTIDLRLLAGIMIAVGSMGLVLALVCFHIATTLV